VAVAYLAARADLISNWWLIVIVGAIAVALPQVAKRLVPAGEGVPEAAAEPVAGELPLELVGVSRPYTEADRVMLDEALGLPAGRG
jgi:hypothetical protein